ncbi:T9SS type A sorting domain-containing protein [Winogradskyella eckloniae]|uniref:T9SS type A sorting domain-containing protein n=1 Tax=Winogradskyella eckloniae TaxID=1089306 RepID=UPI001562FDE4|nr:T9SS type A sorting domain-containing protein [Winogradskyella eckloniae]NRD20857.1 T9SS type A sorting domain-containing protein [Winogradskyella eckloniae]
MKKKLLFMSLVLTSLLSSAQFEVRDKSDDSIVTDGQVLSFSESGTDTTADYNWKFKVTNTSGSDIYMRIFVDEMINSDGSDFQLCFNGICLNSISLNSGYPSTPALIAAGSTNSAGNDFWNQSTSGIAMSWTFRFQAFDASGNTIGTPLSVTYNYDSSLNIEESEFSNLEVYPTSTKDELTVSSNEDLSVEIFDLLGRSVKKTNVTSGRDSINVANLSAQPYIIRFTNEAGQTITKKIIKE